MELSKKKLIFLYKEKTQEPHALKPQIYSALATGLPLAQKGEKLKAVQVQFL